MDASPRFLGGTSIYVLNFIEYLNKLDKKFEITCIFPGEKKREKIEKGVKWVEIKHSSFFPFNMLGYTKKVANFLKKNNFDFINSHAMSGNYLRYHIPEKGFITNTYHGVAYYFYKIHLGEKKWIKKLGALYYMFFGSYLEKGAYKRADKTISVSEHVKKEIGFLYGKPKDSVVVRSSVDTSLFKHRNRIQILKELNLEKGVQYGLYVGRGGPWRKGLDRAIEISKELIKINKNFKLIVIGPSENKENSNLINQLKNSAKYIPIADRSLISKYYSISEIFFCFSRYEGGAPILTLGEAMASGCLPICSTDSNQEIIKDNYNGIILNGFKESNARRINNLLNNERQKKEIIKESKKEIGKHSIDNWGKKYLGAITK